MSEKQLSPMDAPVGLRKGEKKCHVINEDGTVPATNQPEVILFSHTNYPKNVIALPVSAWHADSVYESVDDVPHDIALEYSHAAMRAYHQTAEEYINFVFVIKNVSRAFQQQLTRTRQAAYAIQSMRVVQKHCFAKSGEYTMPPNLSDEKKIAFHQTMLGISGDYYNLLAEGLLTEDARGILPLNIHSDVTMTINLRYLNHMLEQRTCLLAQWEFRQVAIQIKKLVEKELGKTFASKMEPPCYTNGKCPMRKEYCGIKMWELSLDERNKHVEAYSPDGNVVKYDYTK